MRAWALGCFPSYQYRNLSEGADRVGGQLRGDKECPFSGVTIGEPVWPSGKALSPFLIGRMFLREPSWKYSAKLVGS